MTVEGQALKDVLGVVIDRKLYFENRRIQGLQQVEVFSGTPDGKNLVLRVESHKIDREDSGLPEVKLGEGVTMDLGLKALVDILTDGGNGPVITKGSTDYLALCFASEANSVQKSIPEYSGNRILQESIERALDYIYLGRTSEDPLCRFHKVKEKGDRGVYMMKVPEGITASVGGWRFSSGNWSQKDRYVTVSKGDYIRIETYKGRAVLVRGCTEENYNRMMRRKT